MLQEVCLEAAKTTPLFFHSNYFPSILQKEYYVNNNKLHTKILLAKQLYKIHQLGFRKWYSEKSLPLHFSQHKITFRAQEKTVIKMYTFACLFYTLHPLLHIFTQKKIEKPVHNKYGKQVKTYKALKFTQL